MTVPVLQNLDASFNPLSCSFPEAFDVSYNNLSGTAPSSGLFKIINPSLLASNKGLCGGALGAFDALQRNLALPSSWIG